jgi:hypothetical protein
VDSHCGSWVKTHSGTRIGTGGFWNGPEVPHSHLQPLLAKNDAARQHRTMTDGWGQMGGIGRIGGSWTDAIQVYLFPVRMLIVMIFSHTGYRLYTIGDE